MQALEQQIQMVIRLLKTNKYDLSSERGLEVYDKALEWYTRFPGDKLNIAYKHELFNTVKEVFKVSELDILRRIEGLPTQEQAMNGHKSHYKVAETNDDRIEAILPKGGWFEQYAEYTKRSESPLSYYIFSSLSVLGAGLGRRVYKDMGVFRIYPNYCCVLIGPTGVKKTTATDVARDLIHESSLCPIMADSVTPEALASALVEHGGHQLIYVPEFAVLFGKQKYNEGLTTRIIRLLDCPSSFKVKTLARGEEEITDVALTILGASTLSLLSGSTPQEVASSGFLNRFVLVVEEHTDKYYPVPPKAPPHVREELLLHIRRVRTFTGEVDFSPSGYALYDSWYRERKKELRNMDNEFVAQAMERTFNHVIRTAMLCHLAECDSMLICEKCMKFAIDLMAFAERGIPQTVKALNTANTNQDLDFVVQQIARQGGVVDHSTLVRRTSSRMNANTLKGYLNTLQEGGRVKLQHQGMAKYYVLHEEI
jgi:hypothetical protein